MGGIALHRVGRGEGGAEERGEFYPSSHLETTLLLSTSFSPTASLLRSLSSHQPSVTHAAGEGNFITASPSLGRVTASICLVTASATSKNCGSLGLVSPPRLCRPLHISPSLSTFVSFLKGGNNGSSLFANDALLFLNIFPFIIALESIKGKVTFTG